MSTLNFLKPANFCYYVSIYPQGLEMLWNSLNEWLNLLKMEVDQQLSPASSSTTHSLTSRSGSISPPGTPLEGSSSDQGTPISTGTSDASSANLSASLVLRKPKRTSDEDFDSETRERMKRLSLGCEGVEDEGILSTMATRVCTVIQAYYMCCSCQTQQR